MIVAFFGNYVLLFEQDFLDFHEDEGGERKIIIKSGSPTLMDHSLKIHPLKELNPLYSKYGKECLFFFDEKIELVLEILEKYNPLLIRELNNPLLYRKLIVQRNKELKELSKV